MTSFTEQDAKTRVCPMSLGGHIDRFCCGSDCMAWVWDNHAARLYRLHSHLIIEDENKPQPDRPKGVPEHFVWEADSDGLMIWVEPREEAKKRSTGYCGLRSTK